MDPAAAFSQRVAALDLAAHPEGGFYRRWYTAEREVHSGESEEPRAAGSSILFALPQHGHSVWHKIASDELWVWNAGHDLVLLTMDPAASLDSLRLHRLGHAGPWQAVAPAHHWMAAVPMAQLPQAVQSHVPPSSMQLGDDHTEVARAADAAGGTFVTCVVVPCFDWADFVMPDIDTVRGWCAGGHLDEAGSPTTWQAAAVLAAAPGTSNSTPA